MNIACFLRPVTRQKSAQIQKRGCAPKHTNQSCQNRMNPTPNIKMLSICQTRKNALFFNYKKINVMSINNKIIVVDDDNIVLSALKMLLDLHGYENAVYFDDPKKALESIEKEAPDLILSDFMMPQMNGIEFLGHAKKLCPDISMILLTGYADKENAIKAINEIGIYKYIEKPWDNADLLLNIKNGLERSHLISELNKKIEELSVANSKLEKYSISLEEIVKERTKSLAESNTKLSAIINYCADGIVLVSNEGNILQSNPAFENITGLSSKFLIGKHLEELVKKINDGDLNKITKGEEVLVRDVEIKNCINDRNVPVEMNFAPVYDDIQRISGYVGVVRNVSLQKEMERLRDDFIATLTHDLRTPLLAAIQTLQFFLDGSLGEIENRQKTLLDTMKKSNEDMLGLVNALLEVYKYESGKLNLCKTTFSLKRFIEECISPLEALAQKKEITLIAEIGAEDAEITADRNELRRVIMNLCGNALNHTPSGGKIEVCAKNQHGDLIFNVKDNGIGIPKQDLGKLFKRFSQGTSQKRSAGTGLGLYLSRQIVEAHGGKIWAQSEVSKGSDFFVMIPEAVNSGKEVNIN